jgi:hypothetical protein
MLGSDRGAGSNVRPYRTKFKIAGAPTIDERCRIASERLDGAPAIKVKDRPALQSDSQFARSDP